MSFLRQITAKPSLRSSPTIDVFRTLSIAVSRSHFHSSSARQVLNEGNHNDDSRGDHAEHHKQDQLSKQKEGKGHWKQELASNSEAAVKADREDLHASDENIAQMQKQTEEAAQQSHEDAK